MKRVACVGILVADVIVEPVDGYPGHGVLKQVNGITLHNFDIDHSSPPCRIVA